MNCNNYNVLLEKFLEGTLTPEEETLLRQHEDECPVCAARRAALDNLPDLLSGLKDDVPPLPEDFHQGWMSQVEKTAMKHKPYQRKPWLRALSAAAAVMFVIGGTLLTRDRLSPMQNVSETPFMPQTAAYNDSAAPDVNRGLARSSMMDATAEMDMESSMDAAMDMAAPAEGNTSITEKKIIRTVNLTISTQDYDGSLARVKALCADADGWISYVWESTGAIRRSASLTLRIPSDKLDDFLTTSDTLGRITSREERADDVTEAYQDTAAQLTTQQALMERLQSLITSTADLSDLLKLESKIASTQYEIDRLQSSLSATDRKVDYATVDVSLREEIPADSITDPGITFGQRLSDAIFSGWTAFTDFLQDMGVFLAAALPFIAIVAVLWAVFHFIRKARKRKE